MGLAVGTVAISPCAAGLCSYASRLSPMRDRPIPFMGFQSRWVFSCKPSSQLMVSLFSVLCFCTRSLVLRLFLAPPAPKPPSKFCCMSENGAPRQSRLRDYESTTILDMSFSEGGRTRE